MPGPRWSVWVVLAVVLPFGLGLVGCGVDDLGPEAGALSSTTTAVATTTVPTDTGDPLVDTLLAYGYSLGEARCGAEGLRAELDADQVGEIVAAAEVTDIDPVVADIFSVTLTACLED